MAFEDLSLMDDPDLHLFYRKKHYVVPAASLATGRYLHKIYALGVKAAAGHTPEATDTATLNDDQEADFINRCLGAPLLETLEADSVPYKVVALMAQTLLFDTVADRDTAMAFWNGGGKAQAPKGQKTATRTRKAAATTTQKRASQSGTKPAAKATSGPKSSAAGS